MTVIYSLFYFFHFHFSLHFYLLSFFIYIYILFSFIFAFQVQIQVEDYFKATRQQVFKLDDITSSQRAAVYSQRRAFLSSSEEGNNVNINININILKKCMNTYSHINICTYAHIKKCTHHRSIFNN